MMGFNINMIMDLTLAICVYNAEKYLEETLESVMAQTRGDFKLLIVDDCSTDGSVETIRRFFGKHTREYELVPLEKNGGIGHARHFAERHASTRYMMFLDADDILLPEAIETLWDKVQSDRDLMAVGCYLDYIDGKGKKLGGGLYIGETEKEAFIKKAEDGKLIFMQPTAIYDREAALRVGGYVIEGYPEGKPRYQDFCEDLDLWTRMSDLYVEGKAIVVVPRVLCLYRKGGGLSSHTFEMLLKMRYTKYNVRARRAGTPEKTFKEFYASLTDRDLRDLRNEAAAADGLRNGVMFLRSGKVLKGTRMVMRSIVLNPGYFYDKLKHNLLRIK